MFLYRHNGTRQFQKVQSATVFIIIDLIQRWAQLNDLERILQVKKTRWLYIVGQTRVHCDRVEGLGDFAELEVCLTDDQVIKTNLN